MVVNQPPRHAFVQSDEEFAERSANLQERLADADFLANRGLGNEVGFHIFCYDPSRELEARSLARSLMADSESGKLPCRIVHRNLYDLMLGICEQRRILDRIPEMEMRRGSDVLLKQLARTASPEALAEALDYGPHEPGDVLLITGVGEIYPVMRLHSLLNNMHVAYSDIPVVVFYPGRFTGQSFSLFGLLDDGNYYRAFEI